MKHIYIILLVFIYSNSPGQISGIINIYTKVTAINTSCNSVTVSSSSGFNIGDTVLIIQMKGAIIDETASTIASPPFGDINPSSNIMNAGNFEFATIYTIVGNEIYFKNTLLRSYTPSGLVQLVSVPIYNNVTITGMLTASPWNGNTGGILVFEALGTVTFNANIDVSSLGFRGGSVNPGNGSTCTQNASYGPSTSTLMARKGEGIAEYILNKESGRGKQASGGGGGMSNNTGGGGGSNYAAGGIGGKQSDGCTILGTPQAGFPGIGGLALSAFGYSNTLANKKIFLGGGGGGGHQNNFSAPGPPTSTGGTAGGSGGGIVIIKANSIDGNGFSIFSKGQSLNTPAWGDGGGGGGAGGAVLLSSGNYNSAINVDASGGTGDRVNTDIDRNLGPGGGGGSGVLWISAASPDVSITAALNGGSAGISDNPNPSLTDPCHCPFGATAGGSAPILYNLTIPESSTLFTPPCVSLPVELLSFNGYALNNSVKLDWTTLSEKDNLYFIIERTLDLENYQIVSKVDGIGYSKIKVDYSILDNAPLNGLSYYRLSQTDKDGTKRNLKIIKVEFENDFKPIQKIYPNPADSYINIEFGDYIRTSSHSTIKIITPLGEVYDLIYQIEGRKTRIDLSELPKGFYFLVFNDGNYVQVEKIVKTN